MMSESRRGAFFALVAYLMWGGLGPVYFKFINHIPSMEILTHRIIWSLVFLFGLILGLRKFGVVKTVFATPRLLKRLFFSSLLIGGNWLLFIWAINNNHMLDACLGNYINPLINVFLGMIFLGERLRRLQWAAVFLALLGVLAEIWFMGSLPWIALVMPLSFSCYGLMRKKMGIDSLAALFVELSVLIIPAIIYLGWFANSSTSNLLENPLSLNIFLMAAGLVTAIPLLCFTAAANRMSLGTLGFFQYISPTLTFLLAVLVYGEALTPDKMVTFGFIWGAVLLFSLDGWYRRR